MPAEEEDDDDELERVMVRVALEHERAARRNGAMRAGGRSAHGDVANVDNDDNGDDGDDHAGEGKLRRRRAPSASTLASCEWCQQQVSFEKDDAVRLEYAVERESMVRGTTIHEMEHERAIQRNAGAGAEVLAVHVRNAAEALVVDVLRLVDALRTLTEGADEPRLDADGAAYAADAGIDADDDGDERAHSVREVPLWCWVDVGRGEIITGPVEDAHECGQDVRVCWGIVDELRVRSDVRVDTSTREFARPSSRSLVVVEDKTRVRESVPGFASQRPARLQLMVYHRMLETMKTRLLSGGDAARHEAKALVNAVVDEGEQPRERTAKDRSLGVEGEEEEEERGKDGRASLGWTTSSPFVDPDSDVMQLIRDAGYASSRAERGSPCDANAGIDLEGPESRDESPSWGVKRARRNRAMDVACRGTSETDIAAPALPQITYESVILASLSEASSLFARLPRLGSGALLRYLSQRDGSVIGEVEVAIGDKRGSFERDWMRARVHDHLMFWRGGACFRCNATQ